jgi:hypothetical protein
MTIPARSEYRSELFQAMEARARAEGEARGEARAEARAEARRWSRAVLIVLDARGVHVPDAIREQITACTDLAQLDTWLRRAAKATTTADEVVRPSFPTDAVGSAETSPI